MADSAQGNNTENTAVRKRSCVLGMGARGWVVGWGVFVWGWGSYKNLFIQVTPKGCFT